MSVLLIKDIQNTNLYDILHHVNSIKNHVYNDVLQYIDRNLCDFWEVLECDFTDYCHNSEIKTVSDLLYTEAGDRILWEFLDLENLKNRSGIFDYKDSEDLAYFLSIEDIQELLKSEDAEKEIGRYLQDTFYKSFNYICTYGGTLHDRINDFCFDHYQISDIIKLINDYYFDNNEQLAEYIIDFFR